MRKRQTPEVPPMVYRGHLTGYVAQRQDALTGEDVNILAPADRRPVPVAPRERMRAALVSIDQAPSRRARAEAMSRHPAGKGRK